MSMNNEKTACPAGPRTSGEDLGNKENPVCEKTITIQEKSQDSGWHHDAVVIETPTPSRVEPVKSKKSNAQLQQVTELYNVARRAVKIDARVMNADGLCRYDTVDKCRKGMAAGRRDLRKVHREVAAGQGEKGAQAWAHRSIVMNNRSR